jgi:hypothetical protein
LLIKENVISKEHVVGFAGGEREILYAQHSEITVVMQGV